jgi:hypothetical protein
MSSWGRETRKFEAVQRRGEREAKRRQKELERRLKEQAKLSALEQARLEVEAYENVLEVLLSVHKEQHMPVDWRRYATSLPPCRPPRLARNELAALLRNAVLEAFQTVDEGEADIVAARSEDERENAAASAEYERELAQWEKWHSLAKRVLAGEARAYTQAASESPNLVEISNLGSSIHMTVHNPKLVECVLKVNGHDVIPSDSKTLAATGKVVVKRMPKAKFHEIYQDYVCGCILRLAREMFALLPVEMVLMTATVDGVDTRTGHPAELPVLSIAAPRSIIEHLNFEHLNPSDALNNFQHRGDVVASRKSDSFSRIVPLTPREISTEHPETMDLATLLAHVRQLTAELDEQLNSVTQKFTTPIEPTL